MIEFLSYFFALSMLFSLIENWMANRLFKGVEGGSWPWDGQNWVVLDKGKCKLPDAFYGITAKVIPFSIWHANFNCTFIKMAFFNFKFMSSYCFWHRALKHSRYLLGINYKILTDHNFNLVLRKIFMWFLRFQTTQNWEKSENHKNFWDLN